MRMEEEEERNDGRGLVASWHILKGRRSILKQPSC